MGAWSSLKKGIRWRTGTTGNAADDLSENFEQTADRLHVSHIPRGLLISTGTDTDHDLDIAAGTVYDADNDVVIEATSTETIAIDDAADRVDSSTLDADTWYHILIGKKTSDGSFVAGFSKADSLPSGWDGYFRLTSRLTDSSSNIVEMVQHGHVHYYTTPIRDFVGVSLTTSFVAKTFSVPSVDCMGLIRVSHNRWTRFRFDSQSLTDAYDVASGSNQTSYDGDLLWLPFSGSQIEISASSTGGSFYSMSVGWRELF